MNRLARYTYWRVRGFGMYQAWRLSATAEAIPNGKGLPRSSQAERARMRHLAHKMRARPSLLARLLGITQ